MASPTPDKLTMFDRLRLLLAFGKIAITTSLVGFRHGLIPPSDSPGIARAMYTYAILQLRTLPQRLRELTQRKTPASQIIATYCSKHKLLHETDELPNSGKLHWVGQRPAPGGKVLYYIHGGGYVNPMWPAHISFALKCASKANASVAFLQYTLSPEVRYPGALLEAIGALKQILNITSPSNITIAGDSAGGHIILGLLSHLLHPSEYTPQSTTLSENLGGVCLISPFLSLDLNKSSYTRNVKRDYLTSKAVKVFIEAFRPLGRSDEEILKNPQTSPLDAPAGWWKNCPVDRILMTFGEYEGFFDDSVAFGRTLKEETGKMSKVEIVMGSREAHAAPIVDEVFGLKERGSAASILTWMSE